MSPYRFASPPLASYLIFNNYTLTSSPSTSSVQFPSSSYHCYFYPFFIVLSTPYTHFHSTRLFSSFSTHTRCIPQWRPIARMYTHVSLSLSGSRARSSHRTGSHQSSSPIILALVVVMQPSRAASGTTRALSSLLLLLLSYTHT